jgi:hypothetical protein
VKREIQYAGIERIITTFDESDIIKALGDAHKIAYKYGWNLVWEFGDDGDGRTILVATQSMEKPMGALPP